MKKKELIKKLRPFWHRHLKLREEFFIKERKLEEEMNKKLKLDTELEFFYCDGECVGIGAKDYSKREKFPLIHDTEIENSPLKKFCNMG